MDCNEPEQGREDPLPTGSPHLAEEQMSYCRRLWVRKVFPCKDTDDINKNENSKPDENDRGPSGQFYPWSCQHQCQKR